MARWTLAAVAIAALPAAAATPVVHHESGRVSVDADDAPLADVLAAIAREAGATLRGTVPDRRVTIHATAVPLDEALATLLGRDSFSLVYGAAGAVRAIELFGQGQALPIWPPATGDAEHARSIEVSPERQREVMGRPIEVGRRLGAVLGSRHPPVGRVIQAALRQKSVKARAEARERVLEAFARDPEVEDVFYRTLAAVEDATLARMLRDMGGERAEEFLAMVAAGARSEELRAKAGAVLERMRDSAGG